MSAAPEATGLTLVGLSKCFAGAVTAAVADLSLTLPTGTLTALLGPSGCGKSTTLNLVAGLLDPDAGDVRFDGRSALDVPPERRPVAMVAQKALLFPHLTVADNVGFGLRMRRVPRTERSRRVSEMLALVGLEGFGGRRVHQLSGGQEQRVALARALVTEPRVLLLDEPFSALDTELRAQMRLLVRDLQRRLAVTTLFVTHDLAEAVELADTVALMLGGRLEQHGPTRAFYERPATAGAARFFGATNLVPGTLCGTEFDTAVGTVTVGQDGPDGPGLLVLRPEVLRLTEGAGRHIVTGAVLRADYRGTHTVVTVSVPALARSARGDVDAGIVLQVTAPAGASVPVGSPVGVFIPPRAVSVVPPDPPGL